MASIFQTVLQANQAIQQQRAQSLINQARQQGILQQAAIAPLKQAQMQQQIEAFPLQQRLQELEAQALQQRVQAVPKQQQQQRILQIGNLAEQALSIQDPGMRETFITGAAQKLGIKVDPSQVTEEQLRQFVGAKDALTSGAVSEREQFEEQKRRAQALYNLDAYKTELGRIDAETGSLKDKFSQASKIRAEIDKATGDFRLIEDAFGRIQATQKGEVTGASDIALIFNFMKMLDPGSVVREGEFATAENAGGAFEKAGNIYNKLLAGERLTDKQRKRFVDEANKLLVTATEINDKRTEDFVSLGKRFGLDREDIVVRSGPRVEAGAPQTIQEGQTATNPNTGERIIFRNGQWQPAP